MLLSCVEFNPREREAAEVVGDRVLMHRLVSAALPDAQRPAVGGVDDDPFGLNGDAGYARAPRAPRVLWHVSDDGVLVVQSAAALRWDHVPPWMGRVATPKPLDALMDRVRRGGMVRFAVQAAPRVRSNSNRRVVPLHDDMARLAWLADRLKAGGALVEGARVIRPQRMKMVKRSDGYRVVTLTAVDFQGVARITHADDFRALMCGGLGPGKAYGFGLLRIAVR